MRVKRKLSPWCKSCKKAMIDMDMGVQELAEACSITPVYASKITSGVIVPSHEVLSKICEVLDIEYPTESNVLISL